MDFDNFSDSETELEMPLGKSFGFKELVLLHLKKIVSLTTQEMRGGYYSVFTSKDGTEREYYVQDTREAFENGILSLTILMQPKFNQKMKKAYEAFQEELGRIKKEFVDASSVKEEVILGEGFYTNTKDKLLLETYKQKKLELFFSLFTALSEQLSELNYFSIGGGSF